MLLALASGLMGLLAAPHPARAEDDEVRAWPAAHESERASADAEDDGNGTDDRVKEGRLEERREESERTPEQDGIPLTADPPGTGRSSDALAGSAAYPPFATLAMHSGEDTEARSAATPPRASMRRSEPEPGFDYTLASVGLAALAFGAAWVRLHHH